MNYINFFKTAFEKIQSIFPQARLEYEYKDFSETHFVKVTPSEIYDQDSYIDLECEIQGEFKELEPDGALCFITEETLTEINNPALVSPPKEVITDANTFVSDHYSGCAVEVFGCFAVTPESSIEIAVSTESIPYFSTCKEGKKSKSNYALAA